MTKRYNQYRNKATRSAGSSSMDMTDKLEVKKILQDMGAESIKFDMFLGISSWDTRGPTHGLFETMTKEQASRMIKIRHPDVICWYKGKLVIIEVDGAVHKDFDFDKDYDELGIKYLKINKDHLKKEGISYRQWMEKYL